MKKILVFTLIIVTFTVSFLKPKVFSGLDEERKKLEQFKQQLDQVKSTIKSIESSTVEIQSLIGNLGYEINNVSKNIDETETKITALKNEIAFKEKDISTKEQEISQEEQEIESTVNLSYKLSKISPMEVFFEGNDPNTVSMKLSYILYVSSYTKNLMNTAINDKNLLAVQKQNLEKNKKELESYLTNQKSEQEVLLEEMSIKNSLLKSLKEKKTYLLYQKSEIEKEIAEENKKIAQLIEEAKKSNSILKTGLIWPVKGPITDVFGWRINPIWGGKEFHEGIDIGIATGTPVHAAADGEVTYADWMTGYGYMVMLYNGSDVTTLYAHLKSFTVKKGNLVKQGQTIAYSDNTGWSTGPHLHFGVYIGDKAVNPLNYLP